MALLARLSLRFPTIEFPDCLEDASVGIGYLLGPRSSELFVADQDWRAKFLKVLAKGSRLILVSSNPAQWSELRMDSDTSAEVLRSCVGVFVGSPGKITTVLAEIRGSECFGAEKSHLELVDSLLDVGVFFSTYGVESGTRLGRALVGVGSGIIETAAEKVASPVITSGPGSMAEIREVEGALGVLPDVLLAHTVVATVLPHLASRLKLPLVWWLHEFGDVDHGFRYSPSREDFSRWVKGVATVVVANSESVRDHFFGEDSSEIPVIGYLIQGLDNVPTTPRTSDHVSLGVVARIETSKGHSTVLEAVALLVERGTSVSLHLYGSGSTRAVINLKNLVRSLGLEKQVIFHGYVDDAEAIFASLDAVVVASVSEALGRVPIEAGLRGVPVFFNPRGHLASLLEDGVTGISFDSDSPSSLASRIDSLFSNSLDYEKLRLTAWHHWRDSLSVGDYRAEWLGVLKQAQRNYLERAM